MHKPADPSGLPSRVAPYAGGFRDLLKVISLTPGFVLLPVEIPGPDLALALAEWLTGQGHPATVIEPRDDEVAWEQLAASLLQATPGPNGVVLVIGSRQPPRSVFRGLQILNQRRDTIVAHLQCALLWCGPQSFLDLTWKQAPDFWSIRAVDRRLEPESEAPQSTAAPANAKSPWESKKRLWEAACSQGDKHNAAQLAVGLVDALIDGGKVNEAGAVIERQLSDTSEAQNPELLLRQAEIARRRGNPVAAATILATLLSAAGKSDAHLRFRAQLALAGLHAEEGDLASAENAYREARSAARSLVDREGEARALIGLGRATRAGASSIGYIEKARKIANMLGDSDLEAQALAASAEVAALTHDKRHAKALNLQQARSRPPQPPGQPYDPAWYVHRETAERITLRILDTPGSPVVLWGPKQIGKSTLLGYVLDEVRRNGFLSGESSRLITLDLHVLLDLTRPPLSDNFWHALAAHLVREVGGADEWIAEFEAKDRKRSWPSLLTRMMEHRILPAGGNCLLLAIEDAEALVDSDLQIDFFRMLRSWCSLGFELPWSSLRLILTSSTSPENLTPGSHPVSSLFNMAFSIGIEDFQRQQIEHLAALYGFDSAPEVLERLTTLVGGHPYLLRTLMYAARIHQLTLKSLLEDEDALVNLFQGHLAKIDRYLKAEPQLASAVHQVLSNSKSSIDRGTYQKLYDAGIVVHDPEHGMRIRYGLYENHFREHWKIE